MGRDRFVILCFAEFLIAWAWLFNVGRNEFTANMMFVVTMAISVASIIWWLVDPELDGVELIPVDFFR